MKHSKTIHTYKCDHCREEISANNLKSIHFDLTSGAKFTTCITISIGMEWIKDEKTFDFCGIKCMSSYFYNLSN